MASWFRQTSGSYVHADTSRLRQMMQDWVEDQPSAGAAYHNFWDHPYARAVTWHPAEAQPQRRKLGLHPRQDSACSLQPS